MFESVNHRNYEIKFAFERDHRREWRKWKGGKTMGKVEEVLEKVQRKCDGGLCQPGRKRLGLGGSGGDAGRKETQAS